MEIESIRELHQEPYKVMNICDIYSDSDADMMMVFIYDWDDLWFDEDIDELVFDTIERWLFTSI